MSSCLHFSDSGLLSTNLSQFSSVGVVSGWNLNLSVAVESADHFLSFLPIPLVFIHLFVFCCKENILNKFKFGFSVYQNYE